MFGYIISTLAVALILNITLNQTDFWKFIGISVLDRWNVVSEHRGLFLSLKSKSGNAVMVLKNSGELTWVKSMSFSILHDESTVSLLENVLLASNARLETLSENHGVHSYTIQFNTPVDIPASTSLIQFAFSKKTQESESINISTSGFIDKDGTFYGLETAWWDF